MAIFMQHRQLKNRVQQQLRQLHDEENYLRRAKSDLSAYSQATDEKKDHFQYSTLDGISTRYDQQERMYFQVDWESASDPQNPRNWSTWRRLGLTILLISIAAVVGSTIGTGAAVAKQAAEALHVSQILEAFSSIGIVLIGLGMGCFLTAPASELLGRYPVYLFALIIFACWTVGAAVAPNIGTRIVFRLFCGISCSAPLTVPGGSISDVWTAEEKTWTFPLYGIFAFASTLMGPVYASYLGESKLSWRWSEWITLLATGLVMLFIFATMRETFAPRILKHKAHLFRSLTGDYRFKAAAEVDHISIRASLRKSFTRPFLLAPEPIIFFLTLYTSVLYVVLFTPLVGYPTVFLKPYGISQGETNLCFLGLILGILLGIVVVPIVNYIMKSRSSRNNISRQENRLIYALIGAPFMPIGLLWMAWTDYSWISIWSPLSASAATGFGAICVWLSTSMYIIDSYETYAASALTFVNVFRYVAAGVMIPVGVHMYSKLGSHWTLTIWGCISAAITPIPYMLYVYGPRIRARSRYIVHR